MNQSVTDTFSKMTFLYKMIQYCSLYPKNVSMHI